MQPLSSHNVSNAHRSGLYGAVWRWHFYAGLFVAPLLVVLAVTGGLYLFQHEIGEWWYADLMLVQPSTSATLPSQELESVVLRAYPGSQLLGLTLPRRPELAVQWDITTNDDRKLTVFVDPFRGVVQGNLDSRWQLMNVVRKIHGSLLLGRLGDTLIELASCWAFVLVVTGLYLWWPRGRKLWGTLLPRLRSRGRVFRRDLHAVPAVWNAFLLAFLVLSGLPWAGFWGDQLARLGTLTPLAAPTPNFQGAVVPESVLSSDSPPTALQKEQTHHAEDQTLPWAVRHAAMPSSSPGVQRIAISRVQETATSLGLWLPGTRIVYPLTDRGVFKISYLPDKIQGNRTMYIDQYSGAVLQEVTWNEFSPIGKAVEYGVSLHMGRQFGRLNQFVGLASCLLIILAVVSAAILWWKRRLKGRLGAPSLPKNYRTDSGVVVITLALAIVFPLMGASLLTVLILDYGLTALSGRR